MIAWIKNAVIAVCIFTIFQYLVNDGNMARYVRFYSRILFCLTMINPVLALFGDKVSLEQYVKLEFLKNDLRESQEMISDLAELKNRKITEAYQEEIKRQITDILKARNIAAEQIMPEFEEENEYIVKTVHIQIKNEQMPEEIRESTIRVISELLSLEPEKIRMDGVKAENNETMDR